MALIAKAFGKARAWVWWKMGVVVVVVVVVVGGQEVYRQKRRKCGGTSRGEEEDDGEGGAVAVELPLLTSQESDGTGVVAVSSCSPITDGELDAGCSRAYRNGVLERTD